MEKRHPAGVESILLAINIPTRGRAKSTDDPTTIETKEWEVIPQFAC